MSHYSFIFIFLLFRYNNIQALRFTLSKVYCFQISIQLRLVTLLRVRDSYYLATHLIVAFITLSLCPLGKKSSQAIKIPYIAQGVCFVDRKKQLKIKDCKSVLVQLSNKICRKKFSYIASISSTFSKLRSCYTLSLQLDASNNFKK